MKIELNKEQTEYLINLCKKDNNILSNIVLNKLQGHEIKFVIYEGQDDGKEITEHKVFQSEEYKPAFDVYVNLQNKKTIEKGIRKFIYMLKYENGEALTIIQDNFGEIPSC